MNNLPGCFYGELEYFLKHAYSKYHGKQIDIANKIPQYVHVILTAALQAAAALGAVTFIIVSKPFVGTVNILDLRLLPVLICITKKQIINTDLLIVHTPNLQNFFDSNRTLYIL